MLFDPSVVGLRNLYDNYDYPTVIALEAIGLWGFVYEPNAGIVYDRWQPQDD